MNTVMKPVMLLAVLFAAAPALAQHAGGAAATDARLVDAADLLRDCHNATDWAGGVAFDTLTPKDVPNDIDIWEATVRKLRGNLMPPPGNEQPHPGAEGCAGRLARDQPRCAPRDPARRSCERAAPEPR